MKTRCRNYGARKRMAADVSHPSRQDSSRRNHDLAVDESEEISLKEGQVLLETRAQKQAVKFNPHLEHAESIKDSTSEVEPDFAGGSVGVSTRSSTRPSKRLKLSSPLPYNTVDQENKDDHNNATCNSGNSSVATNGKKRKAKAKRQWESWGTKGKDAFFEALHEYGKDFDKIQGYIAAKHKRRGDPPALIKNKDQVRHFYYRTLNKISKYVPPDKDGDESDPHKKTVNELNSLICYGELRKKMCGLNEKHGKKLSELISHGNTTIRYNGRNFKIKAPVCRALKRLHPTGSGNSEDNETHPSTVPSKLFIELTPHNNATWCAVQRMAKNPRLKTTVLPNKPLGSMLGFLSKKWPVRSSMSNRSLKICILVPVGFNSASKEGNGSPMQTCYHSDSVATTPEVSQDICTENKVDEEGATTAASEGVSLCTDLTRELSQTTTADNVINDDAMEASANDGETMDSGNVCDANLGLRNSQLESVSKSGDSVFDIHGSVSIPAVKKGNPTCWTADNCGNLTFSSIYYKLGCPSSCTLKLQYKWQDEDRSSQNDSSPLKKLINIASVEVSRLKETKKSDVSVSKLLTSASSTVCTYPTSRNTKIAPKTTENFPFFLPSVTTRAPSKPVINELPPPLRPVPKPRKQQRKPAPTGIVQRTLLPRPMAPPGAVAVSFIPQPEQEVGTMLGLGISTVSSCNTVSLQSGAAALTTVTSSMPPVPSPSASCTEASLPVASTSGQLAMAASNVLNQSMQDASPLGDMSVVSNTSLMQQQSSATDLAVVPSTFTASPNMIDLGFSESGSIPSSLTVDQFIDSTESLSVNPTTLDSIIGLALGTALNDKEADILLVAVNGDSVPDILASLPGTKLTGTGNLMVSSQPLGTVNSTLSMASSTVQVEELNSGISGGPPTTLATSTLNNLLDSSTSALVCPISTCADSLFCNSTAAVSTVSSLTQDYDEESQQDLDLPAAPTLTYSDLPSLRIHSPDSEPQWLNGEAPDISIGSLLDRLSTSPKKQSKSASFEDLTGSSENKSSSQYSLLPSHHLMDADTAMHAMMDESSVDFIRNFRDLASKLDGNDQTSFLSSSRMPSLASLNFVASGNAETTVGTFDSSVDDSLTFKNILSRDSSGRVGM